MTARGASGEAEAHRRVRPPRGGNVAAYGALKERVRRVLGGRLPAEPGMRVAPRVKPRHDPGDTQMSTTAWPQRPPEPVTDLAARWEGTPGTPADLAGIRRELRAAVRHRPWPTSDEADLERLLLIVEELASNGLRHGRPPVRVVVTADSTGCLLDVSDAAADRPPALARDRDPAAGGLGLPLVARLSAGHGWTGHGERKHVWARIHATPAPGQGPSNGAAPSPRRDTPPVDGGRPGAEHSSARIRGVTDDRAPSWPSCRCCGSPGRCPN